MEGLHDLGAFSWWDKWVHRFLQKERHGQEREPWKPEWLRQMEEREQENNRRNLEAINSTIVYLEQRYGASSTATADVAQARKALTRSPVGHSVGSSEDAVHIGSSVSSKLLHAGGHEQSTAGGRGVVHLLPVSNQFCRTKNTHNEPYCPRVLHSSTGRINHDYLPSDDASTVQSRHVSSRSQDSRPELKDDASVKPLDSGGVKTLEESKSVSSCSPKNPMDSAQQDSDAGQQVDANYHPIMAISSVRIRTKNDPKYDTLIDRGTRACGFSFEPFESNASKAAEATNKFVSAVIPGDDAANECLSAGLFRTTPSRYRSTIQSLHGQVLRDTHQAIQLPASYALPSCKLTKKEGLCVAAILVPAAAATLLSPEMMRNLEIGSGASTAVLSLWKANITSSKDEAFTIVFYVAQGLTIVALLAYMGITTSKQRYPKTFGTLAVISGLAFAALCPGRGFWTGLEAFLAAGFWTVGLLFDDATNGWVGLRQLMTTTGNLLAGGALFLWSSMWRLLEHIRPRQSAVDIRGDGQESEV